MLADEVFVDILRFLDRYNIDAIEFSSLQLRDISLGHLQDDCFRRYEKVSVEVSARIREGTVNFTFWRDLF